MEKASCLLIPELKGDLGMCSDVAAMCHVTITRPLFLWPTRCSKKDDYQERMPWQYFLYAIGEHARSALVMADGGTFRGSGHWRTNSKLSATRSFTYCDLH
jgi:hypothetical protein